MHSNNCIRPERLRTEATLGIVATSEPLDIQAFERGLQTLRRMGFKIVEGPTARQHHGHLAGDDRSRAKDIMGFFTDKNIDAVLCAAGGANSTRLLPLLDYELIRNNPKPFIGMSDPTSILCAIHARTGLVTFHGPVVQYDFGREEINEAMLTGFRQTLLQGEAQHLTAGVLRSGKASGLSIGGNLTSLEQLLGTPFEPCWDGAILFWEDVFEQPHSLDAKLTHFRNSGVFERIAGMVIGDLLACDEQDYPDVPPLEKIVLELVGDREIPILNNVPFGHGAGKLTIPLGVNVKIDSDASYPLDIDPGCRPQR